MLARHTIYETMRNDILRCIIMPGAELREADLAQRFGVSKSPVRDALQRLENEGLVEIEARRGHKVRAISVRDANDVLELRQILEEACVKKVAQVASDEDLASLDRFRFADTKSPEAFARYNHEFHHYIAVLSKNRRLAEETMNAMDFYARLVLISLSAIADRGFDEPLKDHVEVIEALQARNGNAAARVVRRHVGKSRMQIMRALEARPIVG
ncbi:GntR family transcriptional regulator [Xanthobacter sp. KR7-65]|uniref:GntR family transcriptional regulator n=1 Tax=Xanthobacter sp. KR7-65 TaxID=3156612 RepID=UPI0032B4D06D